MALVGENGAGKSTLIKLLGGVYQPDGETIIFDGREVIFSSTQESLESRISVIYQEFNLIPELSVAENIFIGRERSVSAGPLSTGRSSMRMHRICSTGLRAVLSRTN